MSKEKLKKVGESIKLLSEDIKADWPHASRPEVNPGYLITFEVQQWTSLTSLASKSFVDNRTHKSMRNDIPWIIASRKDSEYPLSKIEEKESKASKTLIRTQLVEAQ